MSLSDVNEYLELKIQSNWLLIAIVIYVLFVLLCKYLLKCFSLTHLEKDFCSDIDSKIRFEKRFLELISLWKK